MNISAIDRLSGRLALLVAVAAVLLIVLLGWFALVAPKRAKAADLDSQIVDTRTQLTETQRFLASSAGRKAAVNLKKLNRAVPPDAHISEILRQLSQASRLAGVRVTGVTPGQVVSTEGGQAIPMTVVAEGHYFRLQKFMHLLRAAARVGEGSLHVSGRLLAIDSVELSSAASSTGSGGTNGLITATLAADAFVSAPGQASTDSGTAPSTTGATSTTSP